MRESNLISTIALSLVCGALSFSFTDIAVAQNNKGDDPGDRQIVCFKKIGTSDHKKITREVYLTAKTSCKKGYYKVPLAQVNGSGVGQKGDVGPQGPKGETGEKGERGEKGDTGAVGPQGPIGLKGDQGDVGPQGPQGLTGPVGATGAQGPRGIPGVDGAQGPVGMTGATGPQGVAGPAGPQGPIGLTGAEGPMGPMGPVGPTGPRGLPGQDGLNGLNGIDGIVNIGSCYAKTAQVSGESVLNLSIICNDPNTEFLMNSGWTASANDVFVPISRHIFTVGSTSYNYPVGWTWRTQKSVPSSYTLSATIVCCDK